MCGELLCLVVQIRVLVCVFAYVHMHLYGCMLICTYVYICVCPSILNTARCTLIHNCILCGGDLNGTLTLGDDEGVCSSPHMHVAHTVITLHCQGTNKLIHNEIEPSSSHHVFYAMNTAKLTLIHHCALWGSDLNGL